MLKRIRDITRRLWLIVPVAMLSGTLISLSGCDVEDDLHQLVHDVGNHVENVGNHIDHWLDHHHGLRLEINWSHADD